jgi:hypothetical protein
MAPPLTVMYDLCEATLNALVAGWPGEAEPLPDLQFVTNAQAAADTCEVLAVWIDRTFGTEGDVTSEQFVAGINFAMRSATVAVAVYRCVPVVSTEGAPSAGEQSTSAQLIYTDAQAMLNVLVAAQKAGDLATCNGFSFESWTPVAPEGGGGGGILRYRAMLI